MKKSKGQLMCKLIIFKTLGDKYNWKSYIFRDGRCLFSKWELSNEESLETEKEALADAKSILKELNIKIQPI